MVTTIYLSLSNGTLRVNCLCRKLLSWTQSTHLSLSPFDDAKSFALGAFTCPLFAVYSTPPLAVMTIIFTYAIDPII